MMKVPGRRGLGVPIINLGKCIFCFQCAESCPKKAIRPTKIFNMAASDLGDLILDFRVLELVKKQEGEGGGQEEPQR